MTVRARLAAGQYGIWFEVGTRQMTRSAALPDSSEPISSSRPTARAALIVTAVSASSGVICNSTQATVMASGRLAVGDVPGLKSVPMATGMPRSMKVRAGAPWSFIRNQVVAGSTVATTARPSAAAWASASMPAADGAARWSAEAAPSSAASSAPPDGASSSACNRAAIPKVAAVSRIRRDCSALNTPSSQNTSQNLARPWAAIPGSCSSMIERT